MSAPAATATAAIAAPAAPTAVPTPEPLAAQLAGPIVALHRGPDGEHVVTVRVTPENLGPVTVHAHLSNGDLTVQLFAPTADARDALKAMLPDLRRDLGQGTAPGSSTTLGLGTGDAPQGGPRDQPSGSAGGFGTGGSDGSGGPPARERWSAAAARSGDADPRTQTTIPRGRAGAALLDVLA